MQRLLLSALLVGRVAHGSVCDDYPINPSGSFNITIEYDNVVRMFQLFTPWNEFNCGSGSYCTGPPKVRRPLVLNWHGCNAHVPVVAYHEQISRIEQSASDFNYYAITPIGTREEIIDEYGWNTDGIQCGSLSADDFLFAEKILEYAENNLCVDMSRVYSTGFSTGAFHSLALGCHMTSKFAGIAPIAGSIGRLYFDACKVGPPISYLSFHSKDDKTVPYDGNAFWQSQPSVTEMWEKRNGCTNETGVVTYRSATTLCKRKECPLAAVEDCTLVGLDHCWVGGRSGGFFTPASCVPQEGDIDATVHMFESWEREATQRHGLSEAACHKNQASAPDDARKVHVGRII